MWDYSSPNTLIRLRRICSSAVGPGALPSMAIATVSAPQGTHSCFLRNTREKPASEHLLYSM